MGVAFGADDNTRASAFAVCGVSGIVPAIHFCFIGQSLEVITLLPYLGGILVFYLGGVGIYVSRLPERRWPGRFDYCGQSHNLWHLCVLAGECTWLVGMQRLAALHSVQAAC